MSEHLFGGRLREQSASDPLAREIPDIFILLARNENSGMTTLGAAFGLRAVAGAGFDHRSGQARMPPLGAPA